MRYLYIFILLALTGCGNDQKPKSITDQGTTTQVEIKKTIKKGASKSEIAKRLQFHAEDTFKQDPLPDVKFSDDNILITTGGTGFKINKEAIVKMPSNISALRLENKMKTILWQPKWHFWGAGTIMIPSVVLNQDKSILAIVELFGEEHGPFGSRIILINTYNWKIIAIHTFKDKKITKITFATGNKIYCFASEQPLLKQKSSIFRYNLKTKKLDNKLECNICDMLYIPGNGLCIKTKNDTELKLLPKSNVKKTFNFTTKNSSGILIYTPSSRFILLGNKSIDTFSPGKYWAEQSIPYQYKPISAQYIDNSNQIAFLTSHNELIIKTKNHFRKISAHTGETLYYNNTLNKLIVGKKFKDSLELYSLPDLLLEETVIPGSARPKTKGTILSINYLPHHKKYLVFDSFGNMYLLYKKTRRWEKILILQSTR